jgi:hypothetical protein
LWAKVRASRNTGWFGKTLKKLGRDHRDNKWMAFLGIDEPDKEVIVWSPLILPRTGAFVKYWELFMATAMWYSMLYPPAFVIMPELHGRHLNSMWVFDIFWLVDFFLGFFKAKKRQHNVKEISKDYVTSLDFWCNALATFPAIFSGQNESISILKMLRLVNFDYFVAPANILGEILINNKANLKDMTFLFRSMCKVFLFCHWMALIWLHLGENYPSPFSEPWMIENEEFQG